MVRTKSPGLVPPSSIIWPVLLVLSAAFLLTGAFTNELWFDESFSVAMATHSFAEIWDIGALDVRPVLYYWMLHLVNVIFGTNLIVYRVVTLLPTFLFAVLGATVVRRDYGDIAGLLFAVMSVMLPHASSMSVQLRMYSWAAFSIGACFLCALHIKKLSDAGARRPTRLWVLFALASLASAYLHYFGAIAAFIINLLLMIHLLRGVAAKSENAQSNMGAFVVSTVCQLALYAPWLLKLLDQLSVVSTSYWIKLTPARLAQMMVYPLVSTQMLDEARGLSGGMFQMVALVFLALAAALLLLLASLFIRFCMISLRPMARGSHCRVQRSDDWAVDVWWGVAVYAGTVAFALAASVLLASPIAVARYFYVALPPLLLAISIVAAKLLGVRAIACGCASLIAVGLYGQAVFVAAGYSQLNNEPIDYLEAVAHTYDNDGEPTVISSNILCAGTYAVMCNDVPQTFIAPDTGIGRAYRVYAPVMSFAAHVEEALSASGRFIVVLDEDNAEENDVYEVTSLADDLVATGAFEVVEGRTFYRPYERNNYTVTVLERMQ